MASHLNPPNWQSHVCKIHQLIRDIRHAGLTGLLCMKVEIHQLPTLPTSLLHTSSPTSGGPLAPSGSLYSLLIPPLEWPHKEPFGVNQECEYLNLPFPMNVRIEG